MSCRNRALVALLVALGWTSPAWAQISPTYTFASGTVISSSQVNANFALLQNALNRTGGTITGNITVTAGVTIDGVDLSAWLDQSVKVAATPTFAGLTVTGAGAAALDVTGGINAGSGNVGIVDTTGKIPALSSTYFASLTNVSLGFLSYTETKTAPTIAAGALTINLALGTHFTVALNANITAFTVSNPPAAGSAGAFTIAFTADGTVRTIAWPASFKWAGGVAPTMTGTNTKVDLVSCVTYDAGTSYYCVVAGQNF